MAHSEGGGNSENQHQEQCSLAERNGYTWNCRVLCLLVWQYAAYQVSCLVFYYQIWMFCLTVITIPNYLQPTLFELPIISFSFDFQTMYLLCLHVNMIFLVMENYIVAIHKKKTSCRNHPQESREGEWNFSYMWIIKVIKAPAHLLHRWFLHTLYLSFESLFCHLFVYTKIVTLCYKEHEFDIVILL